MTTLISVQVPEGDGSDIEDLARQLGVEYSEPVLTHPFDGEALLQALIPLTMAGIPVIRAWIKARVQRSAQYRIVYQGIELTGYDADEASNLLRQLMQEDEADSEALE